MFRTTILSVSIFFTVYLFREGPIPTGDGGFSYLGLPSAFHRPESRVIRILGPFQSARL